MYYSFCSLINKKKSTFLEKVQLPAKNLFWANFIVHMILLKLTNVGSRYAEPSNYKKILFNSPINPTNLTLTDLWTNQDLVVSFLDLDESGVTEIQARWMYSMLCGYNNDNYKFIVHT